MDIDNFCSITDKLNKAHKRMKKDWETTQSCLNTLACWDIYVDAQPPGSENLRQEINSLRGTLDRLQKEKDSLALECSKERQRRFDIEDSRAATEDTFTQVLCQSGDYQVDSSDRSKKITEIKRIREEIKENTGVQVNLRIAKFVVDKLW